MMPLRLIRLVMGRAHGSGISTTCYPSPAPVHGLLSSDNERLKLCLRVQTPAPVLGRLHATVPGILADPGMLRSVSLASVLLARLASPVRSSARGSNAIRRIQTQGAHCTIGASYGYNFSWFYISCRLRACQLPAWRTASAGLRCGWAAEAVSSPHLPSTHRYRAALMTMQPHT